MRHTLKWSFLIGTASAGIALALMKLFQPIKYEHLVLFGYALVGSSVMAGYVAHRNLEKRHLEKQAADRSAAAKTDGGTDAIGVQRVQISGDGTKDGAKEDVPEFVPASKLMDEAEIAAEPAMHENGKHEEQYRAAEKFLDEVEKEAENETCKTETMAANGPRPAAGNYFQHCGKDAQIFTNGGKTISGKFAGMDTHVVLEDAVCDSKRKILLMISKSEIARMEIG